MSPDYTILNEQWQGFYIECIERSAQRKEIYITLKPDSMPYCRCCGKQVRQIHEYQTRMIRDLPAFDCAVFLKVLMRRVSCRTCGNLNESISWLSPYARYTNRFADSVGRMCVFATIKDTADFYGLSRKTVKAMDKEYLYRTVPDADLDGIEVIAMDEFAIEKGHRYATVVIAES